MLFFLLCMLSAQTIGQTPSGPPSQSTPSAQGAARAANGRELPAQTSRYNRGGFPGRYRDAGGKAKLFTLKHEASVFDGAGNEIGRARKPVMLNQGVTKTMDLDGKDGPETYVWGWRTQGGSGWVSRSALVAPPLPTPVTDSQNRNPRPPRECATALTIDAAAGRKQLAGLRHVYGRVPGSDSYGWIARANVGAL